MRIATLLLTVTAVLIFSGVLQRVLDRMYLTDRAALLAVLAMFIGTLLPPIRLGMISVNIGGGLIPLALCCRLLVKADSAGERLRALIGALVTAVLVMLISRLLPDEPESMPVDPMLLYGLGAGAAAWLLGRSRRNAWFCGVVGVVLADTVTAVINWRQGIDQMLVLGGGGVADAVVISGVTAVLLTELTGELIERIVRARKRRNGGEA